MTVIGINCSRVKSDHIQGFAWPCREGWMIGESRHVVPENKAVWCGARCAIVSLEKEKTWNVVQHMELQQTRIIPKPIARNIQQVRNGDGVSSARCHRAIQADK